MYDFNNWLEQFTATGQYNISITNFEKKLYGIYKMV